MTKVLRLAPCGSECGLSRGGQGEYGVLDHVILFDLGLQLAQPGGQGWPPDRPR